MSKKTKEVKVEETAMVVSAGAQLQSQVFNIFKDIDFTGLNAAINAIGEHTGDLNPEERTSAISIVGEWENSVISRLNAHRREMDNFVQFFNSSGNGYRDGSIFTPERLEELASQSGTNELYDAWRNAVDIVDEHKQNSPECPWLEDPDITFSQKNELQQQYRMDTSKHNVVSIRLDRKVADALRTWKKALAKDEGVKELVAKANTYIHNVNKYTNECSDKSRLARLNISIASKDVRDSLKNLMNFAINI